MKEGTSCVNSEIGVYFMIALLDLTSVILPGRLIFVKNCGIDPERRSEMRDALDCM